MAAADEPGVCEIALHLASLFLGAGIKKVLDAQPTVAADEWLVSALVGHPIKIEIAHVQSLAKNLVHNTLVELTSAKGDPFRAQLGNERVEVDPIVWTKVRASLDGEAG